MFFCIFFYWGDKMEYVKYTLLLILSLIGIVNIIKSVILLLCKDCTSRCDIVVTIDDSCQNPEAALRSTVLYHEWSDDNRKMYRDIYCIYKGDNEESKEICRRVCDSHSFTHYISDLELLKESL